jgi:hypothetical protein
VHHHRYDNGRGLHWGDAIAQVIQIGCIRHDVQSLVVLNLAALWPKTSVRKALLILAFASTPRYPRFEVVDYKGSL